MTEFYINDPIFPLSNTYRNIVSLYKLAPRDMSIRLGQVLNTYYLASLDPWGITGVSPSVDSGTTANLAVNITTASLVSINRFVYICEWGWWVVFILACITMLAMASAGAYLHWQSAGPDILAYV